MTFPDDRTLVDARWLADNIDDVVVIDSRWYLDGRDGREAYDSGHIPGARFVDLDTDLSAPPTRDHGRHPLPDPDSFAATLGRLGIDGTTPVVVYDDAGGVVAGRMWWMLDALGVPVAVLDGGLAAWDAELVT
ncbi:MAG: sulfurtransferase, partial [Acidimicrobiales bacterium]